MVWLNFVMRLLESLLTFSSLVLQPFSINRVWCLPVDGRAKSSVSTIECSMEVDGPVEFPRLYKIGRNPLPLQYADYSLSTNNTERICTLNITRVFHRLPLRSRFSQMIFHVKCLSPARVIFRLSENLTNSFVYSALQVSGPCEVSAKDLAVWGRAIDLGGLILDGVVVREDKTQTASDLEGLFNVRELLLRRLSSKGIPGMFTSFVWEKMAAVRFVTMSLLSLPDVLNKTMPNLQTLILEENGLQKLPNFPWCSTRLKLPHNLSVITTWIDVFRETKIYTGLKNVLDPRMYLRSIIVMGNPGLDVSNFEFIDGSLDLVSLSDSGLEVINPTIFDKISGLKAINLDKNKFRKIPAQIFRKASGLVQINLANNRLKFLAEGTFQELRKLRRLDLSNNVIHVLKSGSLTAAENLEEINLQNNSLKRIDPGAFPTPNSLKRINLRQNYLRHIPQFAFYSPMLDAFDMSDNIMDGGSFFETLNSLEMNKLLNNILIRQITSRKKTLKLETNKIEHFDMTKLNEISFLKVILKTFTLNFRNNPLTCDCKLGELTSNLLDWTKTVKEITIHQFDSWVCHSPANLRGTEVLSVPQKELKCKTFYPKSPPQCQCYERPPGLPILVDCRNRSLTELPNEVPEGSVEFHLENNQIRNLSLQNSLENVTLLRLSHNNLRHINLNLPSKLREIFLDSNQLTTLPKNFQSFNFSKIDIRNNFFECDCRNKWMKRWLPQVDHALADGAKSVSCSSGKNQGKSLVYVKDDDFTCSVDGNVAESNLPSTIAYILGGLLFTIIMLGFIYRFRDEVKFFLFTHVSWHPFDRVDDSDPSKVYDAFVSYNRHDIEWVMNTLREKLESEDPSYKLCIHDRDFLVGAPISQNIFDSLKTSRRMIMVLTKNFVQSEWCMLEFRAAHRQVLRDRRNYLIIVLFDDVDTKNLDDELKLYLRTNTYLTINDKWFWQKLRYALPQTKDSQN